MKSRIALIFTCAAFWLSAPVAAQTTTARVPPGKPSKEASPAPPTAAEVKPTAPIALPLPIATMIARGRDVQVLHEFDVTPTLRAYVLAAGTDKRIYYVPREGTVAILGLLFDADLNNLTTAQLREAMAPATTVKSMLAPEAANALALARAATTGVVIEGRGPDIYIVYDPACPYCHKLYMATRAMLDRVRLHWIPVAALGPRSERLAEALLTARDRPAALAAAAQLSLPEAAALSPANASALQANRLILEAAGASSVPLTLFDTEAGPARFIGVPGNQALELIASGARAGNGQVRR